MFFRNGFPHGIRSLELPIKIKGGPQTTVLLRVNVTSPEVELSQEMIDFGSVLVGRSKISYIQVNSCMMMVAQRITDEYTDHYYFDFASTRTCLFLEENSTQEFGVEDAQTIVRHRVKTRLWYPNP